MGAKRTEPESGQPPSGKAQIERRTANPKVSQLKGKVAIDRPQVSADGSTPLLDDRARRRLSDAANHRDSRLNDTSLVRGNLLDGVAENLGVVQPNICQDDATWIDNIGSIVGPAETHLDNGGVNLFVAKIGERQGNRELVLTWSDRPGGLGSLLDKIDQAP